LSTPQEADFRAFVYATSSLIESPGLWFIPTFGDGRYFGSVRGSRETNSAYLRQIAEAVDALGYYGALLPTGRTCDDSWIVAAALIPATQRMRFLVAVRPGLMTPTVGARMVATFDQISNGRLLINVVAGLPGAN
jgi:alkanesulfonate monooxygenase